MLLNCKKCEEDYLEGELEYWRCPVCKDVCYPVPPEFTKEGAWILPVEDLPPFKCTHDYTDEEEVEVEVIVGLQGKNGVWALTGERAQYAVQSLLNQALCKSKKMRVSEIDDVMKDLERTVQFLLSQAVHNGWYLFVPHSHIRCLDSLDEERRQSDHEQKEAGNT